MEQKIVIFPGKISNQLDQKLSYEEAWPQHKYNAPAMVLDLIIKADNDVINDRCKVYNLQVRYIIPAD